MAKTYVPVNALTMDQVAARLGISRRTVQRHIEAGILECVRINRLVRITPEQFAVYMEQLTPATPKPAKIRRFLPTVRPEQRPGTAHLTPL